MKAKEEEEINKIIMEFMGCKIIESYKSTTMTMYSVQGKFVRDLRKVFNIGGAEDKMMLENCRFHSSWDWIMFPIKKIYDIANKWEFESEKRIKYEEIFDIDYTMSEFLSSDLGSIIERVIEFIKWYKNDSSRRTSSKSKDSTDSR
jgi:hypothetical protein